MAQGIRMSRRSRPIALLLVGLLAGCQGDGWWGKKGPPPEPLPRPRSPLSSNPVLAGTIGEQTLLADVHEEPLRGFGVVVGLNGKGSRDCPTAIREYLIDFLAKQVAPRGGGERRPKLSPSQLIDSLDTAVVQVQGVVPPGALSGTRFDLRVEAIPGTGTISLAGGLLLPTQLRFFDPAAGGAGMFAGVVLAEGDGPIFVNPFVGASDSASDADLRRGTVLGGGRAIEGRTARLTLLQPSYSTARAIERRINERFGHDPQAASALSSGFVQLTTPPAYARQPALFRQLVTHLYTRNDAATLDRRLRELTRLAASGNPNIEPVALVWEGIGQSATPHLQPFYTHAEPMCRFYAARTGLRLGDVTAVAVLAELAAGGPRDLRLLAIQELGNSSSPQAAARLVPLLDDADQELRIAAYEGLVQHAHPAIRSTRFPHLLDRGQLNLSLDVVAGEGAPLIHVRRTRVARLALFGSELAIHPPVFYEQAEDALTIHTIEDSADLRVFAKRGGRLTDEIVVPPRVADLVIALAELPEVDNRGRITGGLGLPYSRVVQVLADLCRDEIIRAPLVLEQTPLTELLGPEVTPERREADEEDPG